MPYLFDITLVCGFIAFILLAGASGSGDAPATTASMLPVYVFSPEDVGLKDSHIDYTPADSNYGDTQFVHIYGLGGGYNGVYSFSLPANGSGSIDSVVLGLYLSAYEGPNYPTNISAYRLLKGFDEGAVTWNNNDSSHSWSKAGGDYSPEILSSVIVDPSGVYYNWSLYGEDHNYSESVSWGDTFWVLIKNPTGTNSIPQFQSKDTEGYGRPVVYVYASSTTSSFNATLQGPSNMTNITDSTLSVMFNVTGTNNTYNCSALFNGTIKGTNASTLNNTNTNLSITGITNGTWLWRINCSISDTERIISDIWILNVVTTTTTTTTTTSTTLPSFSVSLSSPVNKSNMSSPFDVSYNARGTNRTYNCSVYANRTWRAGNASSFNGTATNLTLNLPAGTYDWYVNCSIDSTETNQSAVWTFTVVTRTTPQVNCWSGSFRDLYMGSGQAEKFCKCASGIYGYSSYKTKKSLKLVFGYSDTTNDKNWDVAFHLSQNSITQVKCLDGKIYNTNKDYYR